MGMHLAPPSLAPHPAPVKMAPKTLQLPTHVVNVAAEKGGVNREGQGQGACALLTLQSSVQAPALAQWQHSLRAAQRRPSPWGAGLDGPACGGSGPSSR